MSESKLLADQLGPFISHPPVAAACDLSKRTFNQLSKLRGGDVREGETSREHLVSRLLYMAESTSTALRINATWSLSVPAMSLLRCRYEQTVRFSWLARQTDSKELAAFVDNYYAKSAKIFGGITPAQWVELDGLAKVTPQVPLTKEEKRNLSRWENLDLFSMAQKRDALAPKTPSVVDSQTIADIYTPVYRQFSSVTHCDAFALNMLHLYRNPKGALVLSVDPQWPAVLCIMNAMFDIIQAHDAVSGFGDLPIMDGFDTLLAEWVAVRDNSLGEPKAS